MNILDFTAKYPKIFEVPGLSQYNPTNLYFNLNQWSIFRHELCHFLEREKNKAFLPNFGFKETFGQELGEVSDDYFDSFVKREIRVMALEKVCPFNVYPDIKLVQFNHETITKINLSGKTIYYLDYKCEQEKFFTRSQWIELFYQKYNLIDSKILVEI